MPFFSQNPATEVVSTAFPSLDRTTLLGTLA